MKASRISPHGPRQKAPTTPGGDVTPSTNSNAANPEDQGGGPSWDFYRDVFGGWRWECTAEDFNMQDSKSSYETREACVAAALAAGMKMPLHERSILCVQPKQELHCSLDVALGTYRAVFTSNTVDTQRCLESHAYDLYVLDYWVPGSSGIHLCREIRRSDPHVPICFYTAAGSEEQRSRAFRAGASSYICETAGVEALSEEIGALMEQSDKATAHAQAESYLAVQAALETRAVVAISPSPNALKVASEALENSAMARAREIFIESGGSLAGFERVWHEVFKQAFCADAARGAAAQHG